MWPFLFKAKIHEPVAIAAIISTALDLHFLWVANLLIIRWPAVRGFFEVNSDQGVLLGLFVFSLILFLVCWCIFSLIFRGRDCSHYRDSAFWFLIFSTLIFLFMTWPPMFEFGL